MLGLPRDQRDALEIAALLHDVGHLLVDREDDTHHERLGAQFLSEHFGPEVSGPVGLHVAAKRYLCGAETDYHDGLSWSSVVSLEQQGGPMSPDELERFRENRHADAAIRLRRYDDLAKVPGTETPTFESFVPMLEGLTRA